MNSRHRLLRAMLILGVTLGPLCAVACNDSPLIASDTSCTGIACECVTDPQQPLCKGYNDRPEASAFEGSFPDVVVPEASDDASEVDAGPDALDDDASD